MKKVLAILVIALFLGGITAPAFASNNTSLISVSLADKDPKKAKKSESSSSTDKKSADCAKKSTDCSAKSSDCDAKAKKDCGGK